MPMEDRPSGSLPPVQRLGAAHVSEVTQVLRGAFRDYPVMRYVLAPVSEAYDQHLLTLIRMFVLARVLRSEPILGIPTGSGLGAVALVSDPEGAPSPSAFAHLRDEVWATLGSEARARYEAFGSACKPLSVSVPHLHLNMIGVRPDLQGRGLSTRLLEQVHRLAHETPGCKGVTLTTERPANLALYAHFGYQVIGHARVDAELETWSLFRPN